MMSNRLIRLLIVLGALAIMGIVFVQSYWTIKTYDLKDQEFHESVMIALRKVAERYATFNNSDLPKSDLIIRRASNYYSVNINSALDINVLEDYLMQELSARSIDTEVEYAVYDCFSDNLVYGNCCKPNQEQTNTEGSEPLRKFEDLVYYFVVKFPEKRSYLLSNVRQTVLFNGIALLACLFFVYAMWVILKQKRLSEMQADFINNMTHEFKTPISSIKIASEVFLKDSNIQKDSRLQHYAQIIKEQNQRLNDQVEKVLNIAKFEKDGFSLNRASLDLNEVISSTIAQERAKLHFNEAKIDLSLEQNLKSVSADKLHLTNVIANILDNAVKYCEQKPEIKISTESTTQGTLLKIKDNGIGIAEEHLKKIGEKFFRVPTGNIHNVKGFGLGLFYVNRIVQAHSWKLDIQSEPNKGSQISILFNE